ncbi:MAG: ATP phosphoribosyltransferase [Candidatus Manganitrophus sp. SB1]|nr:ATP phosphoribosyltransferase [Candidatus Manganitrophus morganii]
MEKPTLTIALSKGRLLGLTIPFLGQLGIIPAELTEESRRLTFDVPEKKIKIILVRATDVPTYVEYGAADVGIVGKDLLLEQTRDVYEPVDLGYGFCRIVLAGPSGNGTGERPNGHSKLRVATKYPNITERYFLEKGIPIEIIKLYGSIELAPLVGLADQIVDLTSSGETLRTHHLGVVDEIAQCTARLIVNRASLKIKYPAVQKLIEAVKKELKKSGSRESKVKVHR